MTIGDLIKGSLRLIGVIASGETPSADEMKDSLSSLNVMLDGWSTKRLTIYASTLDSLTLAVGTASYTVGTGGTFNTSRPTRVLSAYTRDSNGNDCDLKVYTERDRYNEIVDKDTSGRPEELFYDSSYTLGTIYLYPVPEQAYTLYMESLKPLSQLSGYTTEISLPDGYLRALKYNLAIELAPEFGASVPIEVAGIALDSLTDIMNLNAPEVTAKLDIPGAYSPMNIYTGR